MARDIPFVGVTFSPETKPNTDWYLRGVLKSNAVTPTTTAPNPLFSNITGRTYGFSTRRGSTYELGRIEAGECQLGVDNSDGLFDPTNSAGAYYPNLKPYRPLKINCAYPTTGNILNNTNLAEPVPNDAPVTYANNKISVGQNDSDFELGAISNWYTTGTATIVTSTVSPFAGTYKAIVTSPNNTSYAYLDVPVVAGKQITVSVYYQSAVAAQLTVFDGGLGSNTSSSTTLAIAGAWTRASRTLTPNSPKITIRIGYLAASATVSIDNVQVEFGATASTYTTTGPKIYNLFNGFVERYPQTYQAPNRGQANLMATDSIASIARNTLVSPYEALLLQDKALYYYPFSDPAGSLSAVNKSIYTQDSMYQRTLGTPTVITFGATSAETGVPNVGTTNVAINNNYDNYFAYNGKPGTFLTLENVQNVDLLSGKTYTFSFWCQQPSAGEGVMTFQAHSATQWNKLLQGIFAQFDYAGMDSILYDAAEATAVSQFTPRDSITGLEWMFFAIELTYTPVTATTGTYTLRSRVESDPNPTPVVSATVPYIPIQSFSFFGFNVGNVTTLPQNLAHFAVHEGTIDFDAYYEAGAELYGDTTGTRFKKFINEYSGMDYLPYSTDLGLSAMQYAKTYGISLGDYIQTISDTEGGYWYVDGEGFVNFKDRWDRLQQLVPTVIFGDGAGEIPYAGEELVINYDPTYVLNDITISRENGITAYVQDIDSVADYFPRSYSRTTENLSDSQTVDAANFLLSRYKQPNPRPEVLTFTPARNPAIWSTILGLEIGDYVRVNKRPLGAPALSIDCFIEQVEHEFDGQTGDWITKVTVSPAIASYWNLSTIQATTTGAGIAGGLVLNKTGASNPDLTSPRDIIAGQMLQYTVSGTTYVVVVYGTPTETATTVTVSTRLIGTITATTNTVTTSVLTDPTPFGLGGSGIIPMDWTFVLGSDNYGILSNGNLTAFTKFLVNGEIMNGSVVASYLGSSLAELRITDRDVDGTIQPVAGSTADNGNVTLQPSHTASHLVGSTVYGVSATVPVAVPAGTIVTEYLDNQVTRIPYTPFDYSNLNAASTLDAWTNTLNTGTIVTTTAPSTLKYSTATMNPLIDQSNYPSSDIGTGQIFSFYNGTAIESLAVTAIGAPDTDGKWTMTGYKIAAQNTTLNADITADQTTITTSTALIGINMILIGNELMRITAGFNTTTLTVVRGTPDPTAWSVLNVAPHYQYDTVYALDSNGLVNTYASGNAVIEGYNVNTPIIGTTRLGY